MSGQVSRREGGIASRVSHIAMAGGQPQLQWAAFVHGLARIWRNRLCEFGPIAEWEARLLKAGSGVVSLVVAACASQAVLARGGGKVWSGPGTVTRPPRGRALAQGAARAGGCAAVLACFGGGWGVGGVGPGGRLGTQRQAEASVARCSMRWPGQQDHFHLGQRGSSQRFPRESVAPRCLAHLGSGVTACAPHGTLGQAGAAAAAAAAAPSSPQPPRGAEARCPALRGPWKWGAGSLGGGCSHVRCPTCRPGSSAPRRAAAAAGRPPPPAAAAGARGSRPCRPLRPAQARPPPHRLQ